MNKILFERNKVGQRGDAAVSDGLSVCRSHVLTMSAWLLSRSCGFLSEASQVIEDG